MFLLTAMLGATLVSVDPAADARTADGSAAHPYRDLKSAFDAGIKYRRANSDAAVDIVLASGDYPCPQALRPASSFTVRAADGASPRILGSVPVTGWTKTSLNGRDDVWVADLSSLKLRRRLDLFFLDGRSMTMCRYPNADATRPFDGGWAYVDGKPFGMYRSSPDDRDDLLRARPTDLHAWSDPSEGRVNIFPRYNWWNTIKDIACVSNGCIVFTKGIGKEFPTRPLDRYHVMGLREELDVPGEWYHDRKGAKLYFIPPAGVDPNAKVTSVAIDSEVFRLSDATNVVFRGLEICSAAAGIVGSGVGCRIEACRIHDVGFMDGAGVSLSGLRNAVTDCDIWNIGGYGVSLGRGWNAPPPSPEDRDGNLAFNNYIHHTGLVNRHGFGINIGGQGSRLSHNLIHDMPRGGIFYSGRFLEIDHNRVRHCNTEMEDTAAIYGGGYCSNVGTKINYNHVSDSVGFSHDDKGVYSFFKTCAWGIYLDDCSGGAEVVGNLVEHCNGGGMHMHCARFNVVSNNVFVSCAGKSRTPRQHSIRGWRVTDGVMNAYMKTRAQAQYDKFVGPHPEWKRYPPLAHSPTNVPAPGGLIMQGNRIVNNIWYYPDQPDSFAKTPGNYNPTNNLFDCNVYFPGTGTYRMQLDGRELTLEAWRQMGQDVHTIVADPQFANPAKGDYSFRPDSPAAKLGIWPLRKGEAGLVVTKLRPQLPIEAEGVREHPEWLSERLVDKVDPLIGTQSQRGALPGNTLPGPVWPFGMVQPGPDTAVKASTGDYGSSESGYNAGSTRLLGFTQTHLSGTGCCDLQDFLLLPFVGDFPGGTNRFLVTIDKATERCSPGYYAVSFKDQPVTAELTCSRRVAYHRYTFPKGGRAHVFVDLQAGPVAWWRMSDPKYPRNRVVSSEGTASEAGIVEAHNVVTCWNDNRHIACKIAFSPRPVAVRELPSNGKAGKRWVMDFDLPAGGCVVVKAAVSGVDVAGARANFASDPDTFDFDARRNACAAAWEKLLSRVRAQGTEKELRTFYTALYHAFVQPNLLSDADGRVRFGDNRKSRDSKVVSADGFEAYTTFSEWDTFRAAHPLYTIVTPGLVGDFAKSMLATYRAVGMLPKWQMFGGENYCMVGVHSIPVLADAVQKGLTDLPPAELLAAARASLAVGRSDASYDARGYATGRAGVSSTLEWGVDDWATARLAERAGDAATAALYDRRAAYYRNLFDATTGCFRAKNEDGSWRTPFEPYQERPKKGEKDWPYTEGGAFQYAGHVLQDPAGLAALHGGADGFAAFLGKVFGPTPAYAKKLQAPECSGRIGQFALGDEHDQHVPYLWQYAGRPDRTAEIVRDLCRKYYSDRPDGLCGNDDCGQASAWYVFACLGFYPVNPCGGEYVLGAPQLPRVELRQENGKTFVVRAQNLSDSNKYVKSVTLNGRPFKGFLLRHADLVKGGELVFEMTDKTCPSEREKK